MDEHTLDKLEFGRIRQLLARHAQCALGRELALRIAPSKRPKMVQMWLEQATQFFRLVSVRGLPPFGSVRDVRPQVRRAVPPAKLEPEELADLASTLVGLGILRRYFEGVGEEYGSVARLVERIGDFQVIADRIGEAIDQRGKVRDDASERLLRIRREIVQVKEKTHAVFERLLQQPSIVKLLQYGNATFHADRVVLPLKADQKGRLPGIVHRSSDSGQTLFIEPSEAVELNNARIELLLHENEEIARILWELTHLIHLNQKEILSSLDAAAVIDLMIAKYKFARHYEMTLPLLSADRNLVLRQARNPILLAAFEEAALAEAGDLRPETGAHTDRPSTSNIASGSRVVVPIDVRLGDDFDILLITGPNTGGKTATLKTVGLLALMTQAGLPIPAAEGSTLPLFDGIYIDIGDEQSLSQSLSTFSAHMARILRILQCTRKETLVLVDELGAGTDPDEGAALGRAIVDALLSTGCLAMITTHLGALKAVGYEKKRVDNGSVQFDLDTLRPTYHLLIGEPGSSHALSIAARLGMPRKMVDAAKGYMTKKGQALAKAIAATFRARRDAERARRDADMARQEAARATLAAMDRAAALEGRQKEYARWVDRVVHLQPGDHVHVRRFDKGGRVIRVGLEKQHALVDLGAMEVEVPLSDLVLGERS